MVCRNSSIDPTLFERFDDGDTIAPALDRMADAPDRSDRRVHETVESAVIGLIEGGRNEAATPAA